MKRSVLLSLLLAATFLTDLPAQEIIRNTSNNGLTGRSEAVIQTSDGGYLVVGNTYDTISGNMAGFAMLYDADMKLRCRMDLGNPGAEWMEIYDAGELPGGEFILTGRQFTAETNSFDLLLCKLAPNGMLLWKRTYGSAEGETGYKVVPASGNGIVVAGTLSGAGTGKDKMLVMRFDPEGTLLWSKTFGKDESYEAYSITELKSGGFVLTGSCNLCHLNDKSLSVTRLDPEGNAVWSKTFESPCQQVGFNSLETPEGDLLISGISKKVSQCRNNLLLTLIAPDGSVRWSRDMEMEGCVGRSSVSSAGGDGFYIGGTLFNFKKDLSSIFIIKINPDGSTGWSETLGGGSGETCQSMIVNSDRDLVIAGEVKGAGQETSVLLLKANGKGK